MTLNSTTMVYDAIETNDQVCFIIECDAPPARSAKIVTLAGRGVEIACGHWKIRFGNLHPRLMKACMEKTIVLAIVCGSGVTFRAATSVKAPTWRLTDFYWYLDVDQENTDNLKNRPLPRAMSRDRYAIAVSCLALSQEGPPVALCSCTEGIMALPRGRNWLRLSKGLLIDQGLALAHPDDLVISDDIPSTVEKGLSCATAPQLESKRGWRPQLAMIVSDA